MNKQETYRYLDEHHIFYEVTEHPAVFNMTEAAAIKLPHPEDEAKNLFVCDNKKKQYYLITVKGSKRIDLNAFRRKHGLRPLSFAGPEALAGIMGLIPGAVTPLGLLNDKERKVRLFLDKSFIGGHISLHPNDNTATVWMAAADLLDLLRGHGTEIILF